MANIDITLNVNGKDHRVAVRSTEMLLEVLRDRLGYVGTNKVCAQGICGACTVIVDGKSTTSCLALAAQFDGARIITVEGLEHDGKLDPLQEAFMKHGAVQCGYCTPGFLMSARAFLNDNPHPTRTEIIDALRGNICRCTGYKKIIDAVEDVAARSAR
ncbi:MAG: (2Fe-2S)-binding protein [Bradyrhizobiaceae bacterium]|nr:(2Fe-2S)-binding protein [Bradyrhizobiaceae bacterium]